MTKSLWEKQQELQARCYHPAGNWQPVDWRNPQQSIPERIAELAREDPDRPAVVDHQASLTMAELDEKANAIASAVLTQLGKTRAGPGQAVVALLLGVDALAAAAALGVLKTGHLYVGLEPSFPQSRNQQILADAGAPLIVTDAGYLPLARALAGDERQVIDLDNLPAAGARAPAVAIDLDSPAILSYTSGSTGRPKGVIHTHRAAFAQANHCVVYYHIGPGDCFASFNAMAWAGSFLNIFGPLCHGASVGRFDVGRYGLQHLMTWLLATEATAVVGLPVMRQIIHAYPERRFPAARLVMMGGDTIFKKDVAAVLKIFPNALFGIGLALTETGCTTELILDSVEMLQQEVVPLGFPSPGTRIKLLDEAGEEVAPGEVGEIVVQSDHLAAGYWRRPELTAAKFRRLDLFDDQRVYFTGDLGQFTPDGALQHKGRQDFMVKIRGYQVFTNEIEAILLDVDGVREACVVAYTSPYTSPDGDQGQVDQQLVAYLVVDESSFPGVAAVPGRFADLPRHMRPQSYVLLETLPKTATGKPDRARLPLPRQSRQAVSAPYVAPRTATEAALAAIWGEVLGIDDLGVDDDYLELGGDSLQATRIVQRVVERFGLALSFADFFTALTIADMAQMIDDDGGEANA